MYAMHSNSAMYVYSLELCCAACLRIVESQVAWFESYVLRSVFLVTSLQSPGQEKHFAILFMPLRIVVVGVSCIET